MPTLADINLDALRPPGNPDDFELIERPVFSEHWTQPIHDAQGNVLVESQFIGPKQLASIVKRCNERIVDTNDYSPIVIQHTKEDQSTDPEVVGLSGPYFMGTIGKLKPRAAIYAKTWVYKDKRHVLKKYPRLSVEYWCSQSDPGSGYFDPISLLGATTPELNLGVHYAKSEGRNTDGSGSSRLIRYSQSQAAYPGGSNTSPPGMLKKPEKYSKESSGMATLSPQDIQQIVAAITPVTKQLIAEEMAMMKTAMGGQAGGDEMGGDPLADGLGDEMGDGDGDELGLDGDPDLDIGDDLDGMDDDADDAGDDATDPMGDPMGEEQPDENGDDGELDPDGDGDADLPPEIDDEESDMGLGDDLDDSDMGDLPGGDADPDSLDASEADEGDDMAAADDKKKKRYSKESAAAGGAEQMTLRQYQKENAELRLRYEKQIVELRTVKDENAALKTSVAAIEAEKMRAVRYSKLSDLRTSGYVLDIDQELTDADEMSQEQFDRHCTKIVKHYQKCPVGQSLPIPASPKYDGVSSDEKRVRYSKTARQVCEESLKNGGRALTYQTVLENVERNDGKYVPTSA